MVDGASLNTTLPPQSVTLVVVPRSADQLQAAISAAPTSGTAPLTVAFDGSQSWTSAGTVTGYAWTFGDGTSASGPTVTHVYTAAGTYTATLTVTNDRGATAVESAAIIVNPPPTTISAPSNLTAAVSGQTVTLRWVDNAANETGFHIERKAPPKGAWVRVGTVGATVTTFSQTTPSGAWAYRVQAFNGTTGRVSAYSNTVTVRVR